MITKSINNLEAKSKEEALIKAEVELNIPKVLLNAVLVEEKKGFLGFGSKSIFNIMLAKPPVIIGKELIESIYKPLNIDFKMEYKTQDEGKIIIYNIETDNNGLLIGHHGKGLESLQYLLNNILQPLCEEKLIVNVDVGGYKQKRIIQLEKIATMSAKEVIKTKMDVVLKNLTAYERRIIHSKLADWKQIKTHSEGEGLDRKLILSYQKLDKKEQ